MCARGPIDIAPGDDVLTMQADMAQAADIQRFVDAAVERFGGVDVLVPNAGGPPPGNFDRFDDAAWSVTPRQQQRIVAAAEVWLARNPDVVFEDIRFDAVLVAPGAMPRHIQTAFRADG